MIKILFLLVLFFIIVFFYRIFRILFIARKDFQDVASYLNRKQSRFQQNEPRAPGDKVYELPKDDYRVER